VSRSGFESRISWIQRRNANHYTDAFGIVNLQDSYHIHSGVAVFLYRSSAYPLRSTNYRTVVNEWMIFYYRVLVGVTECGFKTSECVTSLIPDDGGSKDLWNVGRLLPDYTALQPRRQPSSLFVVFNKVITSCCVIFRIMVIKYQVNILGS
jgi:hypothetical protein